MNDRRAFFGKLFTVSTAGVAAAQQIGAEPLIVVPQPDPVQLYTQSDVPSPLSFVTAGQTLTAERMNQISLAINNLNLAVFGPKTQTNTK